MIPAGHALMAGSTVLKIGIPFEAIQSGALGRLLDAMGELLVDLTEHTGWQEDDRVRDALAAYRELRPEVKDAKH